MIEIWFDNISLYNRKFRLELMSYYLMIHGHDDLCEYSKK